ncbi:putative peptidasehypothetical protein [Holotrichia oblita]|uniref:Uncharacterized protein n=1 Tax=Holotrichia oblita TaxID=644536 RepID=A0ACB9TC42_HOLOL|nr:putative peptidasehypothetical protein [Holotrichia oblita]
MRCRQRQKQHHTLLYKDKFNPPSIVNKNDSGKDAEEITAQPMVPHVLQKNTQLLLCTATMHLKVHFCKRLGTPLKETNIPVEGVKQTISNITKKAEISIYNVNQNVVSHFFISNFKLPQEIILADPDFNISAPVDVLLGGDVYWGIMCEGFVKGNQNHPTLVQTELGWILEVLYFIKTAWEKVTPPTIPNCFRKAGFGKTDATVRQFDSEDDLPLSVFATMGMMRRAAEDLNITSDQNLGEFIKIDDNTPTENDDFENQTTTSSQVSEANETDDEIEHVQEREEENKIKCFDEALNCIRELKIFYR